MGGKIRLRSRFEKRRFEHYIHGAREYLNGRAGRVVKAEEAIQQLQTVSPARTGWLAAVSRNMGLFDTLPRRLQTKTRLDVANFEGRAKARAVSHSYVDLVIYALQRAELNATVLVATGDVAEGLPVPVLCKAREIASPGCNVLTPLNYERHFAPAYRAINFSMPYRERANRLVWRGSFTGPRREAISRGRQSREWIYDLAVRTTGNDAIDVGITGVPPGRRDNPLVQVLDQWSAERLSLEQQATNKLLLSLEGNDVASGLKWMLASGSCVLMPNPTVDSWFCESFLEPWVHYVPVSSDLSDVEEKVEWCLSTPGKAEEVAHNGREFARLFLRSRRENLLFDDVIRWYIAQPELEEVSRRAKGIIAGAYRANRRLRFWRS